MSLIGRHVTNQPFVVPVSVSPLHGFDVSAVLGVEIVGKSIPATTNIQTLCSPLVPPCKSYDFRTDLGWCVQVNHWLSKKEQDTHHAQKYETFKPQCEHLAKYAQKNDIWVCSFNDMIKYIYIRDNSSVAIKNGYIYLKSDLDKSIFDVPVTIMYNGKCYNVRLGEKCALDI